MNSFLNLMESEPVKTVKKRIQDRVDPLRALESLLKVPKAWVKYSDQFELAWTELGVSYWTIYFDIWQKWMGPLSWSD